MLSFSNLLTFVFLLRGGVFVAWIIANHAWNLDYKINFDNENAIEKVNYHLRKALES